MKLTFSFQTLIMSVLAFSLTIATAVWAVTVYQSIYSIILRGFDQKLLALAGGAAVFTDGDAHADYHREHRITAICGREGTLWGYDDNRRILVSIDTGTSGALPLAEAAALPAAPLRELACDPARGAALGLDAEGVLHPLLGDTAGIAAAAGELDEVLVVQGAWWGRRGRSLFALPAAPVADAAVARGEAADTATTSALASAGTDPAPAVPGDGDSGSEALAGVDLAEGVDRIAFDALNDRFVGVAIEAGELRLFARDGSLQARHEINLDGKQIHGLVAHGDSAWLASDTLLTADLAAGTLGEEPPSPGYYSEEHPFILRYAPAYRQVREAAGLTFLYTDMSLGGDQIRYILDGSVGDDHTPPGYVDTVPEDSLEDMQLAQTQGKAFVSDIRQWDVWGLIKVAAEPIYGSDGRVVALAGADVDIGVILSKTRIALFAVLGVGVGLLLLAGSVSFRVSQGLTRPLREIKASALRIAAGYFDTQIASRGRDEIARLAASLNTLSTRLQSQARQSQAYERTLVSGRMQLALQHALGDELAVAAHAVPGLQREATAHADEAIAGCAEAGAALVWKLGASSEALSRIIQQARSVQMARTLLARGAPEAAQDALFAATPALDFVLLRQGTSLRVRVRRATVLRLHLDGGSQPFALVDGQTVELPVAGALRLAEGWSLQPLMQTEGSTP